MKKKVIIISVAIILLVLLFPIRNQVRDGGTVEYKALAYKVSKIHKRSETEHQDGIVVKIFGKEIFNNVIVKHIERNLDDVIVTEVNLEERAWINSLTKINIKDTNDYFEITEKVKWEVPEHEEGTTISFAIPVPYKFVVDGVSYNGIYELNDANWSKKDEGLDYNLRVVNLTKDGKIEIEVTKNNKKSFSYEELSNMALEYFFKTAPTESLPENVAKDEYHVGIEEDVFNKDMEVIEIRHVNNGMNNTLDARYYINIYTAKGFDDSGNEIDLNL